jgi:hypothetical protein
MKNNTLRLLWTDASSPVHTNNPGCGWHFFVRVGNNPRA